MEQGEKEKLVDALGEDIQICKCGHYHNAVYKKGNTQLEFTDCSGCPCQKFEPEGKGKWNEIENIKKKKIIKNDAEI